MKNTQSAVVLKIEFQIKIRQLSRMYFSSRQFGY